MQPADTDIAQQLPVASPVPALVSAPKADAAARAAVAIPTPEIFVSTPAASGVIKKMSALSPEAEAQQGYEEAQALRRTGQIDAAVGKLRQALEHYPEMQRARLLLASLLQENGQAAAALAQLKTGYEVQASDALAIAAGRLLADQGRRDEALRWLARGQANLRPTDHALMGTLWAQSQRHAEATQAYQRALDADPGQGGWWLGLGLSLEALGQTDASQVAYRKALAIGSFKPEVISFLRERSGAPGE
jgi:MSHA biogenesis protein MshN